MGQAACRGAGGSESNSVHTPASPCRGVHIPKHIPRPYHSLPKGGHVPPRLPHQPDRGPLPTWTRAGTSPELCLSTLGAS